MDIKAALNNNLKGEALKNALNITEFMQSNGLTAEMEWDNGFRFMKNGKSPCLIVFNMGDDGQWFLCDLPVANEPEWKMLSSDLKEYIKTKIKHVLFMRAMNAAAETNQVSAKTFSERITIIYVHRKFRSMIPDRMNLIYSKKLLTGGLLTSRREDFIKRNFYAHKRDKYGICPLFIF